MTMRKAWALMAGVAASALTSGALAGSPVPLAPADLDAVTAGAISVQVIGVDGRVQVFTVGPASVTGIVVVDLGDVRTVGFIDAGGVFISLDAPDVAPLAGGRTAAVGTPVLALRSAGPGGGVTLALVSESHYP